MSLLSRPWRMQADCPDRQLLWSHGRRVWEALNVIPLSPAMDYCSTHPLSAFRPPATYENLLRIFRDSVKMLNWRSKPHN
ncbi:hypothetical protein VTN77DRAFT_4712 [Rasamsonia byssochlamydoides]|uniref:uncharacterized protein n=1 Tax=Rasamsonia byssochlamydoides TaxID=89139 RepID=UPI0037423695